MSTTRGKTTPASTNGSYAPHTGSRSRIELDPAAAPIEVDPAARRRILPDRDTPRTPWGSVQDGTVYADGIIMYGTAGHGGFKVDAALNAKMHPALRGLGERGGWYEEDCAWAAVAVAFPQHFTTDEQAHAVATMKSYYPDQYTAATGQPVDPSESRELRERAFTAAHTADHVAVAASGGGRVGHFGQRHDSDNRAWSAAFDTTIEGGAAGVQNVDDMFIACRNQALRNGAIGDNSNARSEQVMFRHYLAAYGTISNDGRTVDLSRRPQGDLPIVRDIPADMVHVTATIGGNRSHDNATAWLVPADEYKARGEFGFVIDPTRHQQIATFE